MRAASLIVIGIVVAISPLAVSAQTQSFEGISAIARGSINPPDPVDGCNRAKQDAITKAANAGFNGSVGWDRLSSDSDCKLSTQGARNAGYVYIFTARGTFSKRESPRDQ